MDFSSFVLEEQRVQSTHKSSPASHSRSLLPPRSRRRTQTYRRHGGTAESRSDAGSAEKPLSGDGHCPQKGRPVAPRHLRAERRETLPPAARPHAAAGLLSGGRGPLRAPPPPPQPQRCPAGSPPSATPLIEKAPKVPVPPAPRLCAAAAAPDRDSGAGQRLRRTRRAPRTHRRHRLLRPPAPQQQQHQAAGSQAAAPPPRLHPARSGAPGLALRRGHSPAGQLGSLQAAPAGRPDASARPSAAVARFSRLKSSRDYLPHQYSSAPWAGGRAAAGGGCARVVCGAGRAAAPL